MKRAITFATTILRMGVSIIMMALALTLTPIIGASVEGVVAPVLKDIKMISVPDDNSTYASFKVTGDKVRACRFIEVRALVLSDGEWVAGLVSFSTNAGGEEHTGTSRSTGEQSFGIWHVRPDGSAVKFEIVHDCHLGYDTVTELGTWEVK